MLCRVFGLGGLGDRGADGLCTLFQQVPVGLEVFAVVVNVTARVGRAAGHRVCHGLWSRTLEVVAIDGSGRAWNHPRRARPADLLHHHLTLLELPDALPDGAELQSTQRAGAAVALCIKH